MKKLIAVIAFVVINASVFAGTSKVKVSNDSSAVFKVYYTSTVVSKVKVNIFNEKGEKVFSESIKNEKGFVRPYNMSELPAGNYKFEIVDNDDVKTFEFAYGVKSAKESGLTVFVNKFADNKYFLGLGNASNDKVTIKITDKENKEVYNANEMVVNQFAQLFNLEAVQSNVTFKIFVGSKLIKEISF